MCATVNEYLKLAIALMDRRKDYVLLCDAGVSRRAGVPTGWGTAEVLQALGNR